MLYNIHTTLIFYKTNGLKKVAKTGGCSSKIVIVSFLIKFFWAFK